MDRAARNLFDDVELERIESEFGVPFISVSQPTESTPAGRMMRRTLANRASFYTEQQSVDVREGLNRRVQEGWFVCKAPYGYRNVRKDGRSLVEFDSASADNVRRVTNENFSRMSRSRWMVSSSGFTAKVGHSARR